MGGKIPLSHEGRGEGEKMDYKTKVTSRAGRGSGRLPGCFQVLKCVSLDTLPRRPRGCPAQPALWPRGGLCSREIKYLTSGMLWSRGPSPARPEFPKEA